MSTRSVIRVYKLGNPTPFRKINTSAGQFSFDGTGNLFVVQCGSIPVYAPNQSTPFETITLPSGYCANSVTAYPPVFP